MISRYLKAAPLGIGMTLGLLYAMQALIDLGPGPDLTPHERFDGVFVHKKIVEDLYTKEQKVNPIDPPAPPPPTMANNDYSDEERIVYLPTDPTPDPGPPVTTSIFSRSDGPLVSIIKVSPTYPSSARSKGLEGWVIVQFDVTAEGSVTNVVILDTSHSVFNKSAKAATLRFRYKPRVVDGIAQSVTGLRNKFVFNMES